MGSLKPRIDKLIGMNWFVWITFIILNIIIIIIIIQTFNQYVMVVCRTASARDVMFIKRCFKIASLDSDLQDNKKLLISYNQTVTEVFCFFI